MKPPTTLVAGLVLVLCGNAGAQTIRGTVVDPSDRPIAGVLVFMLDSASNVVARALSTERGDFQVAFARAGSYRLRTMRIGFRPSMSEPIRLRSGGEVTQRLTLSNVQVSLDTVRVIDRNSCHITSDSATTATFVVWEQARAALTAAQLTALARAITATTVSYSRTLEPDGRRVRQQRASLRTDYVTQPWRAVSPDSLRRAGYVVTERDNSMTYHAPSLDVLLSDDFVEDHCFRLASDKSHPGMIGVEFAPSPDRRRLPEIRGTVWVDRKSSELRRMEYRYANVSPEQEGAGAGGELEFARATNGGWAISRWNIRMPVLEQIVRSHDLGGVQSRVAEIQVTGGELVLATVPAGGKRDTIWSRPPLVLAGSVTDSASGAPAAGARVAIAGTPLEGTADAKGKFTIAGVLPGSYTLETRTPSLDAIGATNQSTVTFTDSSATIAIRVPTAAQIAATLCSGARLGADAGMIVGTVYARGDSVPFAGATVAAEWTDVTLHDEHGVIGTRQGRRIEARTDARGTYRICGVPVNTALTLHAFTDSTQSAARDARLADGRFTRLDFTVDRHTERGAVFSGVVQDSSRRPLGGADVTLPGLALATVSDQSGAFRLGGIPAGAQHVLVRRVGYGALDTTLVFDPQGIVDRSIVLHRAVTLDSVVVSASRTAALREFEENRRRGFGSFLTRDELAKQGSKRLSDILAQVRGVNVLHGNIRSYLVGKRMTPALCGPKAPPACFQVYGFYVPDADERLDGMQTACYTQVYLDEALMNRGDPTPPADINAFLPEQIEAIEYYADRSAVPARYVGSQARCGVLIIHSRRAP
ncbi:MAG TPA: carboxypeptidase regulatory-like domain-containing protein [Gemmatimonadaceae bacterium]